MAWALQASSALQNQKDRLWLLHFWRNEKRGVLKIRSLKKYKGRGLGSKHSCEENAEGPQVNPLEEKMHAEGKTFCSMEVGRGTNAYIGVCYSY